MLRFSGLPKDAENHKEMPCVIDKLCELHDGLVVEAKGIKEHYFKPYMKRLFEKRVRHTHVHFFSVYSLFRITQS